MRDDSFLFIDEPDDLYDQMNIIPLVDVMLVLLIVFMVAAPLSVSGISVKLPNSYTKTSPPPEKTYVLLTLDANGDIYLEKEKFSLNEIEQELSSRGEGLAEKRVVIRADKKVEYGNVYELVSRAKKVGYTSFNMIGLDPK